jgi:hypothetical protein
MCFYVIIRTSVGNPWLRHSSHPQEKEGGPKKNEKKKKKKKKKNTSLHSLARARNPPPSFPTHVGTTPAGPLPLLAPPPPVPACLAPPC